MNFNFQYSEGAGAFDHFLKTKTTDGLELEIGFDGLDADTVYISGMEFDLDTDECKGLYVNYGVGLDVKIFPISAVIEQANKKIDGIVEEVARECREEEAMSRELSSPYLTGRI